jgi:penicillin V acylase-like amidase (Ntn superfamily)
MDQIPGETSMNGKTVLFLCIAAWCCQGAISCTTFCLKRENHVMFGTNYDFPLGSGFVAVNRTGLKKTAFLSPDEKPASWISKYGSITFDQAGMEFPMGGMKVFAEKPSRERMDMLAEYPASIQCAE